jgi:hypothetical protein
MLDKLIGGSLAKKQEKILKNLPLPEGMSPDMAVQMLQRRLEGYSRQLRRFACANAIITIKDASYDFGTSTIHPGDVIFDPEHCKNQRAEHSRLCTKCREEGLKNREPKVRQEPPKRVKYSRKKRKMMNSKRHGAT